MTSLQLDKILTNSENHSILIDQKTTEGVSPNAVQAKLKKRVYRTLKKKENKQCLDCSKPNPRWIAILPIPPPYASKNVRSSDVLHLGGYCCLECSGAHRRLGTHISFVRSVELDSLREIDVIALENGGNEVVNKIFEGTLPGTSPGESFDANNNSNDQKPDPSSTQKSRESFIRNKYEKKKYIDIKALSVFRQSMLNKMRNGSSLGDITSPSPKAQFDSPASSPNNSLDVSPVKLQVFTSSPRTLAMIEKYLNPKPKRPSLARRIRNSLRRRGPRSSNKKYLQKSLRGLRGIVNVNPIMNIVETRSEDLGDNGSDCGDDDEQSVTSTRSSMSAFLRRRYSDKKIQKYQQINNEMSMASTPTKIETKKKRFRRKRKKRIKNKVKDHPTEEELEVLQVKEDKDAPSTPEPSVPKSPRFRLTPYLRTPKRKNINKQKEKGTNNEHSSPTATRDCDDVERHVDDGTERSPHDHLEQDVEEITLEKDDIRVMQAWSTALDSIIMKMRRKCYKDDIDNEEIYLRSSMSM